jgi:hypothetical protein
MSAAGWIVLGDGSEVEQRLERQSDGDLPGWSRGAIRQCYPPARRPFETDASPNSPAWLTGWRIPVRENSPFESSYLRITWGANSFPSENIVPVVDAGASVASIPSSRTIPNKAKYFGTNPFSAPNRGEPVGSSWRVRFLSFLPDFSPAPENARTRLTRFESRLRLSNFPRMFTAECVSHAPAVTRQRNDREADFRCGANPQRRYVAWMSRQKT